MQLLAKIIYMRKSIKFSSANPSMPMFIKLTSIYNYQNNIKEIKDNCFTACTSSRR